MSGSSVAALAPAHAPDLPLVRCALCSAEAPEPEDTRLRRPVTLVYGDERPADLVWGRDAHGWLVVSYDCEAVAFCPAHAARWCLRHAAALLDVSLPEGLR